MNLLVDFAKFLRMFGLYPRPSTFAKEGTPDIYLANRYIVNKERDAVADKFEVKRLGLEHNHHVK